MKKIFAFLMTFAFAITFSACDSKDVTSEQSRNNSTIAVQSSENQTTHSESATEQKAPESQSTVSQPTKPDSKNQKEDTQSNETSSDKISQSAIQSASTSDASVKQPQQKAITRERAIEIALSHAGLNKTDVKNLQVELDREKNGIFWEVDFEYFGYEYSYDINTKTGEAVKNEKERD